MLWIKIKRVTKAGFVNFLRNGWVSLATILVVVIALFTIGSLIFARAILSTALAQLQDKVDVSVYFKTNAEESDILVLKGKIEGLNEVKSTEYISREQALNNFIERHKENTLITQSLKEISDNPLGAVLNIKAKEMSQFESIANFLDNSSDLVGESSIVDKVNYHQNKIVIEKLTNIFDSTKKLGASISLILIMTSILVTFNTIRLTIYTAREEIGVMRLVGASQRFISGPFVVEGVMVGAVSSVVAMIIFYPLTFWLGPATESFLSEINIYRYYLSNFFEIFLILLFIGVGLGVISSLIAVRRYLKV